MPITCFKTAVTILALKKEINLINIYIQLHEIVENISHIMKSNKLLQFNVP